MIKKSTIILLSFIILFSMTVKPQQQAPKVDLSLAKEIDHSIKLGLKWLYDQQEADGSWQHYPGITALILSSYLRAHPSVTVQEPVIANGFEFLKSCINT